MKVFYPTDEFGPYVEMPLNSRKYPGLVAKISPEDYKLVSGHKWHPQKSLDIFYAHTGIPHPDGDWVINASDGRRRRRKTMQSMHQLLTGFLLTDHKNGDGLDNRRLNLREATVSQNCHNSGKRRRNTSGYKGVYWHPAVNRWMAAIGVNSKLRYLGCFDDKIEAARAYDQAAIEYHGEFSRLNFPRSDYEQAA